MKDVVAVGEQRLVLRRATLWPSPSNWGRQKRPVFGSFQITTSTTPG